MKYYKTILIALFVMVPTIVYLQKNTEEIASKFFEIYANNSDGAFDYLFGTNPWMTNNPDGISNVKYKVRQSANLMGNYIDHELISEKMVGKSFKAEIHMVKYDRQPLRFVFMYYKPKTEWMIYNFSFDEKIDEDLETYLKANYPPGKE